MSTINSNKPLRRNPAFARNLATGRRAKNNPLCKIFPYGGRDNDK